MRSKLFVPASRPERFEKAIRSGADAICIDLEDSVLPSYRVSARRSLYEFLERYSGHGSAFITVRVNPVGSKDFVADLEACVHSRVAGIVLTKVRNAAEVHIAEEQLQSLEDLRGVLVSTSILPTIECPSGLRNAHAIATSSVRVSGLQIGYADLMLPLGIANDNWRARDYARWMLRLAAAEPGIHCYEAAYLNFRDLEGFREELVRAKQMGFSGTSCIHPSQLPVANEVFQPTAEELSYAKAVLEAADLAVMTGQGAATLDGKLVDAPVVKAARELFAKLAT